MVSSSISTVLMTGFIALATTTTSTVNAESMTTPLNYGVYSSATCTGETIEEGAEAISASLILPDYGTSYPKQDACWGISSTYSTSYQKFAGETTMDLAEGRMDEAGNDTAITAYWRIFADNSCIGPSVGAEKMAVEETAVEESTVEEIIETETATETGTAKAADSSASLVTTTTIAVTMMMLVL